MIFIGLNYDSELCSCICPLGLQLGWFRGITWENNNHTLNLLCIKKADSCIAMKDFRLQLDNPPTGIYLAGGTVSGTVIADNNKEPKDYKAIRVRIVGTSNTHWSAERRRYNKSLDASETYIRTYVDVWDRNRSIAPGGHLTFLFPFCLQL